MADKKPRERKTLAELSAEANSADGIQCPKCGCRHLWKVRDTDVVEEGVRRYRVCRHCGYVVRTVEVRA